MKDLKTEVSKPVFFTILIIVLCLVAWYGWNAMKTPGEKWDGKAVVDAAEKHMAANGIDIKTVPTWSTMWYKYHPEYKGPRPPVKMPEVKISLPAAPAAGVPGTPGVSDTPTPSGSP